MITMGVKNEKAESQACCRQQHAKTMTTATPVVTPTAVSVALCTAQPARHTIFAAGEKVVGSRQKPDCHNTVGVCKERLVAISKVQTPNFDVLVRRVKDGSESIACNVIREHEQQ